MNSVVFLARDQLWSIFMYFKEREVKRGKDVRNKTKFLVTEFSVHPHFLEEGEIL